MRLLLISFVAVVLVSCGKESLPEDFDFQGHRGAMGVLPENTIPSFLYALDKGVKTVEFDVVISADSQVVISHEPWFRSTICLDPDGNPIPEEEEEDFSTWTLTYREISRFDCGSLQNPRFPDQQNMPLSKPLMRDAIIAMDEHAEKTGRPLPYFSVETKSRPEWDGVHHPEPEDFMDLVYDVLAELDVLDRVIIQSFDPRTLQHLRQRDEGIAQAYLMYHNADVPDGLEQLGYTPEIFSPFFETVDERMVRESHEAGMKIIPWTVNEKSDMQRLVELGVDGLITDYPNRFRELYD